MCIDNTPAGDTVVSGPSSERQEELDRSVIDEANVVLSKLTSKKEEFAYLPLGERIRLLDAIVDRIGDWEVASTFGKETLAARNVDHKSADGAGMVGAYGIILAALIGQLCTKLKANLRAMQKTGRAIPPKRVDLAKELGFDPTQIEGHGVQTYDMGTDPLMKIRSIIINEEAEGGISVIFYQRA